MSVDYYNANGPAYFAGTVQADVAHLRDRLLAHVRPGGTILDAGCGSGRDAKAFAEACYEVTAFDASPTMAALAGRHTNLDVSVMTFAEMAWKNAFDGIWASASLLHVPREDLRSIFGKFADALRPGGAWYLSMKHGEGTRHIEGRTFTDVTEREVRTLITGVSLDVVDFWFSEDVRPDKSDLWINMISKAPIE